MSGIYKVTAPNPKTGRTSVRWAGSMAQVREHKAALSEANGIKPSAVKNEELEIAYSKAGTIEFLNAQAEKDTP